VTLGDARPVIWQCFACKDAEKTRNALIVACQIDPRCLIRSVEDERRFEDNVMALFGSGASHVEFQLRVRALLESYPPGVLPRGAALKELAARAEVSLSQVYKRVPALSTGNNVRKTKIAKMSNHAGQSHA
jgi:hypothetical protein